MTTKPKQLTLSATGTILLLLLIAAGAFLFIRNASLRKDFERVQIASYVYKADKLADLAKKRHPEAQIVLNRLEDVAGKNGKDTDLTLVCDLVIGGGVEEDSLETINRPSWVIADKAGNIYVAEYRDGLIKKFSEDGELLMSIFRENDFMMPAEMKIIGQSRYRFPSPSLSAMIRVFDKKIINWIWLPEQQSIEIGTIIDIFDLDGRLVQTIALPERVWANSMDNAGRIYGTRNTNTEMQVVRYVLK